MIDFQRMNEAQQKAVRHGEGPLLVLAGPGSGKTFTITNRILYLTEYLKIPPGNILVITFTKEAALSMRRRFLEQQGSAYPAPVRFATFHSLFYQILLKYSINNPSFLNDSEKNQMIIPLLKQIAGRYPDLEISDFKEESQRVAAAFSCYKNSGNFSLAEDKLPDSLKDHFPGIMQDYEKIRRRSGKLDFDDMVYQCLQLLNTDEKKRLYWQNCFRYIMIDEFQDINPIQYQTIRLLCAPPHNLFAVGDDDQSIYGFRGSNPALMRDFLQDYPDAGQILLNINYRSRPEIVTSSLRLIAVNKERFSKDLRAAVPKDQAELTGPSVCMKSFPEKEDQYRYLTERLIYEQKLGNLDQCAVLCRTNLPLQGFASWLTRASVPFTMKEKHACIYDHFIARDIRTYLTLAAGSRERSLFLSIMNKPCRSVGREALVGETISLDTIANYYREMLPYEPAERIIKNLEKLKSGLKQMKHMKPYLSTRFILKSLKYEEYLIQKAGTDKEKRQEWLEFADWLSQDARNYQTQEEWFVYQDAFRKQLSQNQGNDLSSGKGVKLMSAHASKGLEFMKVFLPDVNEGSFPHGHSNDLAAVEEERRIFYVAMTRAKEALELLFVTGTKERPKLPSRFLQPLR